MKAEAVRGAICLPVVVREAKMEAEAVRGTVRDRVRVEALLTGLQ